MIVYNPSSLPKNDNLNRFAYVIDIENEIFIRKGKMIAFYGNLRFESLGSSILDILVKNAFNAPKFVNHFIVVNGRGQLILGDNGNDLACYDLDDANLTISAKNLLGFTKSVQCQESTMPGFLTLLGTGKVIASSNGPVHFMEPPCRVDEQAVLGWADCPSPAYRYDFQHVQGVVSAVGALTSISLSGEEKQVDFTGKGTVLIQSSELDLIGSHDLSQILAQLPRLGRADLVQLNSALSERIKKP